MINKKFIDDFIEKSKIANLELQDYIKNDLKQSDMIKTEIIGEGGDKSAKIDIIAENIFKKYLLEFADMYSEESGIIKSKNDNNCLIVIDPLDGSDNLIHSLPYYGSSVALKEGEDVIAAVVFNLVNGEFFIKSKFNNEKIKTKNIPNTEPYIFGIFERAYKFQEITNKLSKNKIKYRSPGAVALSLANAYEYDFVLFAGEKRSFDLEAALYICEGLNIYKDKELLLVAKDIRIFNQILEILKEK